MKVPFSCGAVLALTSLTSLASAKLDLTFPFSSVTAGETYELGWMQDANYVGSPLSDRALHYNEYPLLTSLAL